MARLSTCALQSEATLAETSVLRSSGVATTTGLFVGEEAGVGGSAVTGWKRPTRLAGGRPAMAVRLLSVAIVTGCQPPLRPAQRLSLDNTCVTYLLPNKLARYIFIANKSIKSLNDSLARPQNDNQFGRVTIIFSTTEDGLNETIDEGKIMIRHLLIQPHPIKYL